MVVAQALAELIPSVIFVVVGDGPLRPELEATAARLGIARYGSDPSHSFGVSTELTG